MSFQHILLQLHHEKNGEVFQQLHERVFVGSSSEESFSSIHADLIGEIYKVRTQGTAGPLRSGYSNNTTAMNTWVKLHILMHGFGWNWEQK